jgi:hypothetical protein
MWFLQFSIYGATVLNCSIRTRCSIVSSSASNNSQCQLFTWVLFVSLLFFVSDRGVGVVEGFVQSSAA